MSRQMMRLLTLAVFIVAIVSCASQGRIIIKNEITAEELADVGKVFVTLNDGTSIEFSRVEMVGDILKGTTDAREIRELNIQDLELIWIERQHWKPGYAFLYGVLIGISFLFLIIY